MITLLGGNEIYTVPEITEVLYNYESFAVVNELPDISVAKKGIIYYKRTGDTVRDTDNNIRYLMKPFVIGISPTDANKKVWYTIDDSAVSESGNYDNLKHLPTINGEKFVGDITDVIGYRKPEDNDNTDDLSSEITDEYTIPVIKARGKVSEDAFSGGYEMTMLDNEIINIVDQYMGTEDTDLYSIGV